MPGPTVLATGPEYKAMIDDFIDPTKPKPLRVWLMDPQLTLSKSFSASSSHHHHHHFFTVITVTSTGTSSPFFPKVFRHKATGVKVYKAATAARVTGGGPQEPVNLLDFEESYCRPWDLKQSLGLRGQLTQICLVVAMAHLLMCYLDQAFVTLATNDPYVKGALVLGTSLRQHNTTRKLVVLITPQVSDSMRKVLDKVFDDVRVVNVLDSEDSAHLALMQRPELGVTLTKLHCWTLTQYTKCVFMDADTLVLSNVDELFERSELSAAPDPGWPDCFNSGVFVYQPSIQTYNQLLHLASEKGSFDGGDQGLLNTFFSSWATKDIHKHLPFVYNLSSISIYSYLPAFKAFGDNAKVVHFLGKVKPWNYTYDSSTKSVKSDVHDQTLIHPEFLSLWWDIYATRIVPLLTEHGVVKDVSTSLKALSGLVYSLAFSCRFCREEEVTEAVAQMSIAPPPPPSISSEERRERWEQGQVDYMGEDSYENIRKKLDSYLQ
ncbi:glycogenin-1 [Pelodytes ibericus]